MEFLKKDGLTAIFGTPCQGTAGMNVLNLLGLEQTEKALMVAMAERRLAEKLMSRMVSQLGIDMPGNGIALTIPVSSIGGASCMKYLMENQNIIIGGVANMDERPVFPYDMIVAITERGCVDIRAISESRRARAGGTILHAKGTGTEFTARFFGVSIASEKDILLIVAAHDDKDAIMRAIMEKAGIRSAAHTAMISLPVESVVGLTSIMHQSDE